MTDHSNGGGLVVYVKKGIKINNVIVNDSLEIMSIIITLPINFKQAIIACYRPPYKENTNNYLTELDSYYSPLVTLLMTSS